MPAHHKCVQEKRKEYIIAACIDISKRLNYTIEEVLDHTIPWIIAVGKELAVQDLEDKLLDMAMHGIPEKEINKVRSSFDSQFDDKKEKPNIPLMEFQNIGLSFGRPSSTRVIRPEHKEKK